MSAQSHLNCLRFGAEVSIVGRRAGLGEGEKGFDKRITSVSGSKIFENGAIALSQSLCERGVFGSYLIFTY